MPLRFYLLLFFANPASDKTVPFGEDLGGASQELTDMVQHGGPDGIVGAMLVSNKKLIRVTALKSKAWHIEQRDLVLGQNARDAANEKARKREDIESRFAALQQEAEDLGILLPNGNLIVQLDGDGEGSPLMPVDMGDLMHGNLGNENTPPAPPAGAQGIAPANVPPPAPPAPAQASQASPKGSAPKAQPKGAATAKNTPGDAAKGLEGAADSDSAPGAQGAPGDLLEGA